MTYCPELNKELLGQLIACRILGNCVGLGSLVSTNINTIKAGCEICHSMFEVRQQIDRIFGEEIYLSDFRNNTYNDYLKVLLNPMWVDSQSFCMSGKQRIKLTESLANWGSLCYTINGLKGMFNEET